jgi:hypothetical protein
MVLGLSFQLIVESFMNYFGLILRVMSFCFSISGFVQSAQADFRCKATVLSGPATYQIELNKNSENGLYKLGYLRLAGLPPVVTNLALANDLQCEIGDDSIIARCTNGKSLAEYASLLVSKSIDTFIAPDGGKTVTQARYQVQLSSPALRNAQNKAGNLELSFSLKGCEVLD